MGTYPAGFDEELAELLNFTPADLASNRQGKISARQLWLLRWRYVSATNMGMVVMLLAALSVLGLVIFTRGERAANLFPLLLSSGLVAASVVMIMMANVPGWKPLTADLRSRQMKVGEGRLFTRDVDTKHFLVLDNRVEFECSRRVAESLNMKRRYRVYYVPQSCTLLSAEVAEQTT